MHENASEIIIREMVTVLSRGDYLIETNPFPGPMLIYQ